MSILCNCFVKKKQRKGIYLTENHQDKSQSLPPINRSIIQEVKLLKLNEDDFLKDSNINNQSLDRKKKQDLQTPMILLSGSQKSKAVLTICNDRAALLKDMIISQTNTPAFTNERKYFKTEMIDNNDISGGDGAQPRLLNQTYTNSFSNMQKYKSDNTATKSALKLKRRPSQKKQYQTKRFRVSFQDSNSDEESQQRAKSVNTMNEKKVIVQTMGQIQEEKEQEETEGTCYRQQSFKTKEKTDEQPIRKQSKILKQFINMNTPKTEGPYSKVIPVIKKNCINRVDSSFNTRSSVEQIQRKRTDSSQKEKKRYFPQKINMFPLAQQQPSNINRVVALDNPQNYCYFNSIVQLLLGVKEFCQYFYSKRFLTVNYQTYFDKKIYCQAYSQLINEIWNLEDEYDYLKPVFFHKIINPIFNPSMQHDAHEFLIQSLSQLQDELNPGPQSEVCRRFSTTSSQSNCFWQSYKQAHPSIIDQLFVGQLQQCVKCNQCGTKSNSSLPFKDLSLQIKDTLSQSIHSFIAAENLDIEELYNCEECKMKTKANIKSKFSRMPEYLVIHFKRFEERDQKLKKITKAIEYPLTYDFDEECNKSWSTMGRFNLIGVVIHKGLTLEKGHYATFSKRYDGKWWYCSDKQIQLVADEEHVLQQQRKAYILLYQKIPDEFEQ